jgi:hypothetical protein
MRHVFVIKLKNIKLKNHDLKIKGFLNCALSKVYLQYYSISIQEEPDIVMSLLTSQKL